jgi:hypothetical protein
MTEGADVPYLPGRPGLSRALILRLQTTCGNRAVQQLISRQAEQKVSAEPHEPGPEDAGVDPARPRRWSLASLFSSLFGRETGS